MAFKNPEFYFGKQIVYIPEGTGGSIPGVVIGTSEVEAFGETYVKIAYIDSSGEDAIRYVKITRVGLFQGTTNYNFKGEDIGISEKGKEELLEIINQDKSAEEILLDLKDHLTN